MTEINDDEVQYPNEIQKFYYAKLKWCGCGSPAEVMKFMHNVLQTIYDRRANWTAETTQKIFDLVPRDTQLGMSYMYMLDGFGLLEHGTSIGGSWLSDEGERVLKLFNDYDGLIEDAMYEDM